MAQETREEKVTRLEAELTAIRVSIADAQTSQSLGVFGRNVTRANLETLYKERNKIEVKLEKLYDTKSLGGVKFARFRD